MLLENLAQFYSYDFSEVLEMYVDEDGRFGDVDLTPYWVDEWRHPFLLRVDDKLAGFALISERSKITGKSGVFDMTEFFVLRRFRRHGVGRAAAFAAFDRFGGPWPAARGEPQRGGVLAPGDRRVHARRLRRDPLGSAPVVRDRPDLLYGLR